MHSPNPPALRHHSLVLSDLHLGAKGARADLLLTFLNRHRADHYFLVGDILDLCHPDRLVWSPAHQAVIDHFRARHAEGARLTYVRGNHDPDPSRAPLHLRLPVTAQPRAVMDLGDGRRLLVIHGDEADRRIFQYHWMTRLGSRIDRALRHLDEAIDRFILRTPAHRRSLIEALIDKANRFLTPGRDHEERLVAVAMDAGFDGVLCGHFHKPALHQDFGRIYANAGDWVDSFSALALGHDGTFRLLGGRQAYAEKPVFRPIHQAALARQTA